MKITKGNQMKEVSAKAGTIAISKFGWSEQLEPRKPSEIGTRTRKIEPPVITSAQPVKLKEKADYPGDESGIDTSKTIIVNADEIDAMPKEKKTRKAPVRSKSVKK